MNSLDEDTETTGEQPTGRTAVIETTSRMLRAVDLRNWDAVQACFTERVDADYSSIGGIDETLPADELVGGWADSLGSLDATHHMAAGHVVAFTDTGADEDVTCLANFQAQHVLTDRDGSDIHWLLGGRYEFGLRRTDDGWRIAAITMTAVWDEGDETVFEQAGA